MQTSTYLARAEQCQRKANQAKLPPDQALPEVWITEDDELEKARTLLHALRHPKHRHWVCRACGEVVDGPFEQCWNCGAEMPS